MIVIEVTLLEKSWTHSIKNRFDTSVLRIRTPFSCTKLPLRTVSFKRSYDVIDILTDTHTREIEKNIKELIEDSTFPIFVYKIKQREGWKPVSPRYNDFFYSKSLVLQTGQDRVCRSADC